MRYRKINRTMLCFSAFENFDHKKSSLSLPYRRQTINDIDSISLTTDDLLKLPADGSFSFTYVGPSHRISKKNKKCIGKLSSSDTEKRQNFQEPSTAIGRNNLVTPVVYKNINGKQCGRLKTPKLVNKTNKCISEPSLSFPKKSSFKDSSENSLEKNYPRWLTGQKSLFHKAVSGETSAFLEDEQLIPPADSSRGIVCSPLKSKAKVRRTRKGSKLS